MGTKSCDEPIKCWCFCSWRQCCYLTMASALVSLGVVITVQGLRGLLSIGQLWVLGPILLLCGITIGIASLFAPGSGDDDDDNQKNDNEPDFVVEEEQPAVPPEEDAVPMEPLIFLM